MTRTRNIRLLLRSALVFATMMLSAANAFAVLADAGHRPFHAHVPNADGVGEPRRQFREPYVEISNSPASPTTITVYTVVKRTNNPFGTANQTGGALFYKGANDGVWQSVALGFHANEGDFQYWKASFSSSAFDGNEVIQYYFQLTFDAGAENTFIYAGQGFGDLDSQTTNSEATAASNAFTIRNRPAWIFHANNRVTSGNSVEFWAKVGYIGDPNNLGTRWATNGAIYYTTDGSEPTLGATPGTGSGNTQVAAFDYSHPESNNMGERSIAGTPMWWVARLPNLLQGLPLGTTVRYKLGFWHSANNEQKFAEHNAGTNNTTFSFTHGVLGEPVLTVNGLNANYTTSKLYLDEMAAQSTPVSITFAPGEANVTEVEVFTNLNRRERAEQDGNNDGIEDGIVPVDGNTIAAADDHHYFKAYTMSPTGTAGEYALSLSAQKTGAYRLTARWKVSGDPAWRWYTNTAANRRDHAITVAPVDARNINLYEINTLNIEASGDQFAQRSTFEDLYDAPNAPHNYDPNNAAAGSRWNLDYLKNLGANWLWFQPIHPPGIDGREINPNTGQPYEPGSPYAVKNFFEVSQMMSVHNNRAGAMAAFQGLVAAADQKGVGIMLDAPFNHTAYDVELAQIGVQLFAPAGNPSGWQATDQIRNREARFFSRAGAYNLRASDANNIAPAPDREDFGKWNDTKDVFFGVYAALVHSGQNGNYNNEGDWFDYGSFEGDGGAVTRNVWKYFAEYTLYWLDKTGVPRGADMLTQTWRGIDGLRADFGQGLPPQLWEYITNKTRTRKWNFVFMSESLDGGAVTYRSNRHFDILNENIVFPLKDASNASDFRNIFENRRNSYGLGLVLINNTSHDEENYVDPWQALVRYAVAGTVDGVPMIFPGQELGISRTFGYDHYELNFGKMVAHFKRFNSMMPAWNDAVYGNDQLYPVYQGIGQARLSSRALRSSNRYFLNEDGNDLRIFGVAKYETINGSPASKDVVFAFANTNRSQSPTGNFRVNHDVDGNGVNDYGLKPHRTYAFKNIAAYLGWNSNRRNVYINRKTGQQLLDEGLFVAMNGVPTTNEGWGTNPYEAQYLKVYDVTPPAQAPGVPTLARSNEYGYAIDNGGVLYTWAPVGPDEEGIQPWYKVTYQYNNMQPGYFYTQNTSNVFQINGGNTLAVSVQAVNPNDPMTANSPAGPSSGSVSFQVIHAHGDDDGDGTTNLEEDVAGTNPFDANSLLKVIEITRPDTNNVTLTWMSVPDRTYQIEGTTSPGGTYTVIGGSQVTANGASTSTTVTTGENRFFRVAVVE